MLGKLLTVLTEILSKPTFPVEWSSLSVSLIKTILITVKQTSQCIVQQINFDKLLWMSFFRLSSSFILSPLLNIDDSKNGRVSILSELPSNIRLWVGDGVKFMFLIPFCINLLQGVPEKFFFLWNCRHCHQELWNVTGFHSTFLF